MESVIVKLIDSSEKGKVTLADGIWAADFNKDLVAQAINVYNSNQRVNPKHLTSRGDARGGGAKPWKQKGTGRARAGSRRSPVWVGGGVTFTSSNDQNWSRSLNKKMKIKAIAAVLADRVRNESTKFVDFDGLKTAKDIREKVLALKGKNLLVVTASDEVTKALRNVTGIEVVSPMFVNIANSLGASMHLIDAESVAKLEERLKL